MESNIGTKASSNGAGVKTFDGDPFAMLPVEIHKEILDSLGHRGNVLAICQASSAVQGATNANGAAIKQFLETELGSAQLRMLLHDALAAVMFPITAGIPTDTEKKAELCKHLQSWKSGELYDRANDNDKMAAYTFIDQVVIPFAEDFAALTQMIGQVPNQIRVPDWAHASRCNRAPPRASMNIWHYETEERVRLIRAFCRFELLSKVIQARPGGQLYTFPQQRLLLAEFFDAWEVEEILCVQLYIGDMHTILLEAHLFGIFNSMRNGPGNAHCADDNPERRFIRLRRGPFEDDETDDDESEYESDGSASLAIGFVEDNLSGSLAQDGSERSAADALGYPEDTSDDSEYSYFDYDESDWFTKTGDEADPGTLCTKFELAGREKHSTFIKQIATFGLELLQHFIKSDKQTYSHWIRANGHILLDSMTTHEGANTTDPPPTNADLSHGRFPGTNEAASNAAWKHIDATNPQLREAFRRCAWVFWSDARLRGNIFWNRRLAIFAQETAPSWLHRPPQVLERDEHGRVVRPTRKGREPEYFLPRFEVGMRMESVIGRGGGIVALLGFSSAAEVKLLAFLSQNKERRGNILFCEHPFDFLRREEIPLDVWEECMGGEDPPAPVGTVEVFRNVFWG
ncbi:hypothetical protein ColLi_12930 [Colletotrichum liriopes]|uniref:Uncharacterized protein n=1 Tax=Colletotrichum liriopes TaxID=708192 RepID=A0AA37H1A3_9PEZI|nr:hypothetical protein ColLi_12930 [Colletotrichum liriopes]